MSRDHYRAVPSSPSPTRKDGPKVQKLQNVSIQELKRDIEKSRQQQEKKKVRLADMRQDSIDERPKKAEVVKLPTTVVPVESLDITASLDVVSVGSPIPSPVPDISGIPQKPEADGKPTKADSETVKPKPKLAKTKRSQGSVSGMKLTELEIAKLGRLAAPTVPKAKSKSPVKASISPAVAGTSKLSPRVSPRPSPRASPIPAKKKPEEGEVKKADKRLPRNEIPTRREKLREKQQQKVKDQTGVQGEPGRSKAESTAAAAAAEGGKGEGEEERKQSSSDERSGSRERKLSRDTSKDVASKAAPGSRKQSLFDGQSPSSRTTKNISDYGHKLVALCRKGDWVGVDTVIKYINKYKVEFDSQAASETTGWSPLMFAVRDNRIQIVEQLIDIGFSVNTRAKVGQISL